jgi:hypothetical protein
VLGKRQAATQSTSIINCPLLTSEQQKTTQIKQLNGKGETESFFFKGLSDREHMLEEGFLKEHNKKISTF